MLILFSPFFPFSPFPPLSPPFPPFFAIRSSILLFIYIYLLWIFKCRDHNSITSSAEFFRSARSSDADLQSRSAFDRLFLSLLHDEDELNNFKAIYFATLFYSPCALFTFLLFLLLQSYCQSQLCSEYLECWLNIEHYKKLSPGSSEARTTALHIWNEYTKSGSTNEIGAPTSVVNTVKTIMDMGESSTALDENSFNVVQDYVYRTMRDGPGQRYMQQEIERASNWLTEGQLYKCFSL